MALDNVCVFQNADDVFATYQRLRAADVVVFAATVQDRYLSSRWKMFLDRSFFYNHVPIFSGKQIVYVVAGPLGNWPPCGKSSRATRKCSRPTSWAW